MLIINININDSDVWIYLLSVWIGVVVLTHELHYLQQRSVLNQQQLAGVNRSLSVPSAARSPSFGGSHPTPIIR